MGTDLYALCASDSGGKLYRVDPGTGAIKSQVSGGPMATELTSTADGRIAVVNSGASTDMLITPTSTGLLAQGAVTLPNTPTRQDMRRRHPLLLSGASETKSGPTP